MLTLILFFGFFFLARKQPAVAAGLGIAWHGMFSNWGSITSSPTNGSAMFGICIGQILFFMQSGNLRKITQQKTLLLWTTLLFGIYLIGSLQEIYSLISNANLYKHENVKIFSVKILLANSGYFIVALLGICGSKNSAFFKAFCFGNISQYLFYLDDLNNLLNAWRLYGVFPGFDIEGINRAYIAYEANIAAAFCVYKILELERKYEKIYFILILFAFSISISNSKGPFLALVCICGLAVGYLIMRNYFIKAFGILIIMVLSFFSVCKARNISNEELLQGMTKLFTKKKNTFNEKINLDQSIEIRKSLAIEGVNKIWQSNVFFGSGFGACRSMDAQTYPREIQGGTHILFLDLFIDTGILGLCLFLICVAIPLFIFFITNTSLERIFVFCLFLIFLTKSILASDTYSEPITCLFLAFILLNKKPT